LALACTLIHEPEILLLDEPTTGVDPVSRREFWDILTDLHLEGTTIIVSTPYMDEAERCSRVGLMYAGKLMVCDQPQQIRKMVAGEMIALQPENWRAALPIIEALDEVIEVQTYGEPLRVFLKSAEEGLKILEAALQEAGQTYHGLRPVAPRMEEAFISLIRGMEA
jgi:ABC-2 type transport system ATP-binding protein